jgi:ribosome-binding protein aMBF1 (putative translation factor)
MLAFRSFSGQSLFGLWFHGLLAYGSNVMQRTPSKLERRVGQAIRRRRRACGYTLRELSERAKLDLSQLSKIERGFSGTGLETYGRIARAMKVKVADLLV